MILYLDSSALVKRYVAERGTAEVTEALSAAQVVGTAAITRVEVSAVLGNAVRVGALSQQNATRAREALHQDWPALVRVQVSESLVERADDLGWNLGLRGYDAVQLACAMALQEGLDTDAVLATFDQQLWDAAVQRGLAVFPESLAPYLRSSSRQ